MGTQIASLFASLTLNSASFISNWKKAGVESKKQSKVVQDSLETVKKAATALAGLVAVDRLKETITSALEYAGSLGEVSQQLGVSTKDLQVFRFAATQVGIAQEDMDGSLAKLTKTIGLAATGAKQQQHYFDVLGVSIKDASGKIRPTGDILRDVADRLQKVQDPAKRAAVEIALFGKTGQKLDTLLSDGRKGIEDYADAAQKLGLVLTSDQIKHADDAADKLSALHQVLKVQIAGTVADNAQSILTLANSVGQLMSEAVKLGAWMTAHPAVAGTLFGGAVGGVPGAIVGFGAGTTNTSVASQIAGSMAIIRQKGFLRGTFDVLTSSAETLSKAADNAQSFSDIAGKPASDNGGGAPPTIDLGALNASETAMNTYLSVLGELRKGTAEFTATNAAMIAGLSPNQIELATLKAKLYADIQNKSKDLSKAQTAELYRQADAQVAAKAALQGTTLAQQIFDDAAEGRTETLRKINDLAESYWEDLKKISEVDFTELGQVADKAIERSPLNGIGQRYLDDINSARVLQDSIDSLQIDGLRSVNDELTDIVTGTKSVGDAFHDMALRIASDLIHIAIEQEIVKPLANALFGGGSGFLTSLFGGGRASGGEVDGSKFYVVGERGPELFAPGRSGAIIPNGAMRDMASNDNGGRRQQVEVVTRVEPSPLFAVAVAATTKQVSASTTR